MRIAVLGDIHGNINALKKATENAEKQGVDFILSTGDLVDTIQTLKHFISYGSQYCKGFDSAESTGLSGRPGPSAKYLRLIHIVEQ